MRPKLLVKGPFVRRLRVGRNIGLFTYGVILPGRGSKLSQSDFWTALRSDLARCVFRGTTTVRRAN